MDPQKFSSHGANFTYRTLDNGNVEVEHVGQYADDSAGDTVEDRIEDLTLIVEDSGYVNSQRFVEGYLTETGHVWTYADDPAGDTVEDQIWEDLTLIVEDSGYVDSQRAY